MRTIAATCLTCLMFAAMLPFPGIAQAKCMSWNVNSWPSPGSPLPLNGRIMIDEFSIGEREFRVTRPPVPPVLVAGREEIPLDVVERLPGNFRNRQVVFAPRRPLAADTVYTLRVDGAPARLPSLQFRTGIREDLQAPRWTAAPAWVGEERVGFGCGPSSWVFFEAGLEDDSEVRVRVEIRSIETGEVARFLVTPEEGGRLALGHGMCAGGFDFRPGAEYTATFTAVDLAGNEAPAPGGIVSFLGPADGARFERRP